MPTRRPSRPLHREHGPKAWTRAPMRPALRGPPCMVRAAIFYTGGDPLSEPPMVPLLLLTVSTTFAAKAGSLKDLDKHPGFRTLAFGDACPSVEGFRGNKAALKAADKRRTEKTPYMGQIHYRNPADELKVGDVPLLDVGYTCYADQLMSVRMLSWGPGSAEELLFTFTTAFGAPPLADPDNGTWRWAGKKVVLNLRHDFGTDEVTAVFTSVDAVEQKRADDAERRRSSVEDL